MIGTIIFVVFCFIFGIYLLNGINIVRPTERGAIETLGKYTRFANPGFVFIFPVIQRLIKVNITEQMADVNPMDMITKDNLNARVDLVVYYKIKDNETDIKKSIYNVYNVEQQIISLAQTTARNQIGGMDFKEVNSKRDKLNSSLAVILDKQSDDWGIQIVRVELKEITPPKSVQETMNKVIQAENEKDSAINFATAEETKADGIKRAKIKEAEGEKQSSILKAEGQAEAFKLINESFNDRAQLLEKLKVTQLSLKDNSKIILTEKGITPQLIIGEIPLAVKEKAKVVEKKTKK